MLDLKIYKVTDYDPYCGNDSLCILGAEQLISFVLWVVIILLTLRIGIYLGECGRE